MCIRDSLISERTRLSLEVKKGQGAVLGKPENLLNNHSKAIANSVLTNRRKAMENENNRRASALILSMRKDGATFFQMAHILNREGFRTSRGYRFTPAGVWRLYRRYAGKGRGDFGEETPLGSPLSGK